MIQALKMILAHHHPIAFCPCFPLIHSRSAVMFHSLRRSHSPIIHHGSRLSHFMVLLRLKPPVTDLHGALVLRSRYRMAATTAAPIVSFLMCAGDLAAAASPPSWSMCSVRSAQA